MTESNRPRHSLDDDGYDEAFAFEDDQEYADDFRDSDYDSEFGSSAAAGAHHESYDAEYDAYDDSYDDGYDDGYGYVDERDDERAAAAGAAGAGAAGSDGGSGGLPLRGLAMILLAVAVLLIAWGGFTFFGGGSGDDNSGANTAQEQTANEGTSNGANNGGDANQPAPEGQQPAEGNQPGVEGNQGDQNSSEAAKPSEENKDENQGEGTVDKAETQVTILNNSPVQGLASQTADKLNAAEWRKTNYGNLPDTSGAFSESVVLYPANDKNAKAAAEEIAKELGIKAEARNADTDGRLGAADIFDGSEPGKIIVVTTNDMAR